MNPMIPKLFAFDLDGTLLDSNKRIRPGNIAALREMRESGAVIALATGRVGFSVRRYAPELGFDPALVILNGAEIFVSSREDAERIYFAPLESAHAQYLTGYATDKPLAVNFYHEDRIYSVETSINKEWIEFYRQQISVDRAFLDDFSVMNGISPSKIIFIGEPSYIDEVEAHFQSIWGGGTVYVCRSFSNYLEFMNPGASKGLGLKILCDALNINPLETMAYGDEENDVPMFSVAGTGVAMKNGPEKVKRRAARVTELGNDEDWIAREWEKILAHA
jgi:Cof subfamily protein (haloacid dehalogenase superfamily)